MNRLIPGRSLCGFWGIFEHDVGDPDTESPMRVITPSFIGKSLLPFRCPKCLVPAQDLACPVTREHYKDPREGRSNHFCPNPSCGCRFKIDFSGEGEPLRYAIPAGATVGPSKVTYAGEVTWQDAPGIGEKITAALGTIFGFLSPGPGGSSPSGYAILGSHRNVVRLSKI